MTDASPLPTFPGTRAPDRTRTVDAHGIHIAAYEWGAEDAPPLALVHGGFDFARTFDVFAPLLADGGWRVVAWDQRGHGNSEHVALYSWTTDVRDAVAVLDTVTDQPLPVVGHSKGGSLMLDLASTLPARVRALVNIDGLPSRRNVPDVADHQRTKLMAGELANWLDHRRGTADAVRKPGTIEELAERRARMNPRLPMEWLQYLVTVGARQDEDGWRWTIDPALRLGGFGPFRPEWALGRLALVGAPVLALLGQEPETMGWGTKAEDVLPYLPPDGEVREMHGLGHFIHIEQPRPVAEMVLDFLAPYQGPPPVPRRPTRVLRHNRIELALHHLRGRRPVPEGAPEGSGETRDTPDTRPLLLLHGLGSASPDEVPDHLAAWPGPVWALDFTGHGASSTAPGGGYFAEVLMGDVDTALAELGPCTLYGRGLGAYIGLLIAGARPDLVRGAILDDGPGVHGGGGEPVSGYLTPARLVHDPARTPDPAALLELSRDLRPGDYASTFARQAATLSGLDVAVAVVGAARPPWLREVIAEPGVQALGRDEAVALFAGAG